MEPIDSRFIKKLIVANNAVWKQMYYDDVFDFDDFQLSYLKNAQLPWYNCAHVFGEIKADIVKRVEYEFSRLGQNPAFYVESQTHAGDCQVLIDSGYRKIEEFRENWLVFNLNKAPDLLLSSLKLRFPINFEIMEVNRRDSVMVSEFLHIDAETNDLSHSTIEVIRRHIENPSFKNRYYLGSFEGKFGFIGSMGMHEDVAILAEGGTLQQFRGHGLHKIMTLFRLKEALQLSASWAMYTTDGNSLSMQNALKLGFECLFYRNFYFKE